MRSVCIDSRFLLFVDARAICFMIWEHRPHAWWVSKRHYWVLGGCCRLLFHFFAKIIQSGTRWKIVMVIMESFLFGPYRCAPCGLWHPSNPNRNLKRHKKVNKINYTIKNTVCRRKRYTFWVPQINLIEIKNACQCNSCLLDTIQARVLWQQS